MALRTTVTMMYCGQGQTNLVEVYDDVSKTFKYTALFDCGGSSGLADDVVNAIVTGIGHKPARSRNLDLLVISHQDEDHNGYLPKLADAMAKKKYGTHYVYTGGAEWGDQSTQRLTDFCSKTRVLSGNQKSFATADESNYLNGWTNGKPLPKSTPDHLCKFDDQVFVRLLVSGVEGNSNKNASSLVAVLQSNGVSVVFSADATEKTMLYATEIVDSLPNTPASPILAPRLALTVPHHGSRSTAINESRDKTYGTLSRFAKALGAQWVVASAGPFNSYSHPFDDVLLAFKKYLAKDPSGTHTYVAYYERWKCKEYKTDSQLYTTLRTIKDTTEGLSVFIDMGKRTVSVSSVRRLNDPSDPARPVYAPGP